MFFNRAINALVLAVLAALLLSNCNSTSDTSELRAAPADADAVSYSRSELNVTSVDLTIAGVKIEQQTYLKASQPDALDWFGYSVAVSGDTLVVGSPYEDSSANGSDVDNRVFNAGAVYVFVREGGRWRQQAILKASNADEDNRFGHSVALDADTLVVSALLENRSAIGSEADDGWASNSGAAYVFVRDGGVWTEQAYLKAANAETDDYFGTSVAVSGDTLVVGANGEDSVSVDDEANNSASKAGAAYVFVRDDGVWRQQAYLKASNVDEGDQFGEDVAIFGDTVIVSAIREDGDTTNEQQSNNAEDSGATYVFVRDGSHWRQQAYLKASNADAGDLFGESVSLDGDTLVVGASDESSSATGGEADNSSPYTGAIYVFVRNGDSWRQQAYLKASNADEKDSFGASVALNGDKILVASPLGDSGESLESNDSTNSGVVYVFVRDGDIWNQQAYLKASNTGSYDEFGFSVALSGDIMVGGAPQESSNGIDGGEDNSLQDTGAVYVWH